MNIWLCKKICSRWIPHNLSITQKKARVDWSKKCSKNTIRVLRNKSMTSWQVINCGFTLMSPKVNSSRLYGCFKMKQIQQKFPAHEALPSKWSPLFFRKIGHVAIVPLEQEQNNKFWVVHNHLFAYCLPRNQENQPKPKTDHSSPQQCELSHTGSNNCIFEHSNHRFDESSAV